MKNSSIKRLKDLYLTEHYKRLPSIPLQCRCAPNYKPTTANGLTRCVLDFLRLSGWQSERIGNTGRMIDNTKVVTDCIGRPKRVGSIQWIKGTGTNGTADISATVAGRSIKIEIKIGKDRQSDVQRKYQADVERSGGVYLIVKTLDDFLQWYDDFVGGMNHGK